MSRILRSKRWSRASDLAGTTLNSLSESEDDLFRRRSQMGSSYSQRRLIRITHFDTGRRGVANRYANLCAWCFDAHHSGGVIRSRKSVPMFPCSVAGPINVMSINKSINVTVAVIKYLPHRVAAPTPTKTSEKEKVSRDRTKRKKYTLQNTFRTNERRLCLSEMVRRRQSLIYSLAPSKFIQSTRRVFKLHCIRYTQLEFARLVSSFSVLLDAVYTRA